MPRTCKACSHAQRKELDAALAAGTPLRSIAAHHGISPAALARHKAHAGTALLRAAEKRELAVGDSVLEGMARVQAKAWDLVAKLERQGDYRGAAAALREVRATLEAADAILARGKAGEPVTIILPAWMSGGPRPAAGPEPPAPPPALPPAPAAAQPAERQAKPGEPWTYRGF